MPWLRRRILPIGSFIIATEVLPDDVARSVIPKAGMCFDTKNFLYYWRLSPDRRRSSAEERRSFAPTTVERARDKLHARWCACTRSSRGAGITSRWGGNVALTVDRDPHLGRRDGITYAMGYCGRASPCRIVRARAWRRGEGDEVLRRSSTSVAARAPAGSLPWLLPVGGWWYQLRDRL